MFGAKQDIGSGWQELQTQRFIRIYMVPHWCQRHKLCVFAAGSLLTNIVFGNVTTMQLCGRILCTSRAGKSGIVHPSCNLCGFSTG